MPETTSLPALPSPASTEYRDMVHRVLEAATGTDPALAVGTIATVEGMSDIVEWACRGQSADETASIWLQNFRWARVIGLTVEPSAPLPPRADWETTAGQDLSGCDVELAHLDPTTAQALGRADMQYPARHDFPDAVSPAFIPRLTPLALYPQDSTPHLGQLVANVTSLTHGSPEALACGVAWVFLVRTCLASSAADSSEQAARPTTPTSRIGRALADVAAVLPDDDAEQTPAPRGLRQQYAATGSSDRGFGALFAEAPETTAAVKSLARNPSAEDPSRTECVSALVHAVRSAMEAEAPVESGTVAGCLTRVLREAARSVDQGHGLRSLGQAGSPSLGSVVPRAVDAGVERWTSAVRTWDDLLPRP